MGFSMNRQEKPIYGLGVGRLSADAAVESFVFGDDGVGGEESTGAGAGGGAEGGAARRILD